MAKDFQCKNVELPDSYVNQAATMCIGPGPHAHESLVECFSTSLGVMVLPSFCCATNVWRSMICHGTWTSSVVHFGTGKTWNEKPAQNVFTSLCCVMRLGILYSGEWLRHRTSVGFTAIRRMNTRYLTRCGRHWARTHHRVRRINTNAAAADDTTTTTTSPVHHHILMHWRRRRSYQCHWLLRWTCLPINRLIIWTCVQNGRAIAQRNHTILIFRCSGCSGHYIVCRTQLIIRFGCNRFNLFQSGRHQIVAATLFHVQLIGRCSDVIHIWFVDMRELFHFRLIWWFQFACTIEMCTFEVCGEIAYRMKLLQAGKRDDRAKRLKCFSIYMNKILFIHFTIRTNN